MTNKVASDHHLVHTIVRQKQIAIACVIVAIIAIGVLCAGFARYGDGKKWWNAPGLKNLSLTQATNMVIISGSVATGAIVTTIIVCYFRSKNLKAKADANRKMQELKRFDAIFDFNSLSQELSEQLPLLFPPSSPFQNSQNS